MGFISLGEDVGGMQARAHHWGVTVSDLDRALEFYTGPLDLEVTDRFTLGTEEFNRIVGTSDRTADIAFLNAGDVDIELLEYDEPGANRNAGGRSNDVGVAHVSLEVDDVRAVYDDLSGEVDFYDEPQTLENGATVVLATDPDGNVVELIGE